MASCKELGDLVTHNIVTAFLEDIANARDLPTQKLYDYTVNLNKNIEILKQQIDVLSGAKNAKTRSFYEKEFANTVMEMNAAVFARVSDAPIYKQMFFDILYSNPAKQAYFPWTVDIINFVDDISGKLDVLQLKEGLAPEQISNSVFRYAFVEGLRRTHGEEALRYAEENWVNNTKSAARAIKNKAVYDYLYISQYGVDQWYDRLWLPVSTETLWSKAVEIQKSIDAIVEEKLAKLENPTKEDVDNIYAQTIKQKFGDGVDTETLTKLDNDVKSYVIIKNINSGIYDPLEIFGATKWVSLPKWFGFRVLTTNLDETEYGKGELLEDFWSNLETIKQLEEPEQMDIIREFHSRLVKKGIIDANRFANIPSSILDVAEIFDSIPRRFVRKDISELTELTTESVTLYKAKTYGFGFIGSIDTLQEELKKIYKTALAGGDVAGLLNNKKEITTEGIRKFFANYVEGKGRMADAIKNKTNNPWFAQQIKDWELGRMIVDVAGVSDEIIQDVFRTKYFQDFIAAQSPEFREMFTSQLVQTLKKYKVATIDKWLEKNLPGFIEDLQAIYKAQFLPEIQERFSQAIRVGGQITQYDILSRLSGGSEIPRNPEIIYIDLKRKSTENTDYGSIFELSYRQNTIELTDVQTADVLSLNKMSDEQLFQKIEGSVNPNTVIITEQYYLPGTEQADLIDRLRNELGIQVISPRPWVIFKEDNGSLFVSVLTKQDRAMIRQSFPDAQYFSQLSEEELERMGGYIDSYLRAYSGEEANAAARSIEEYTTINPKESFVEAKRYIDTAGKISDGRIITKTYDATKERELVQNIFVNNDIEAINRILKSVSNSLGTEQVQITAKQLKWFTKAQRDTLINETFRSIFNDSAEEAVKSQVSLLNRIAGVEVPWFASTYTSAIENAIDLATRDEVFIDIVRYIESNGITFSFDRGSVRWSLDYVVENFDKMPSLIDQLLRAPGNDLYNTLPLELQSLIQATVIRNQDVLSNRGFLTKYVWEVGINENSTKAANLLSLLVQGIEDLRYASVPEAVIVDGVTTSNVDNAAFSALHNIAYYATPQLNISTKEMSSSFLSVLDDVIVGTKTDIKNKVDGKELESFKTRFNGVVDSYIKAVTKSVKAWADEALIRAIHTDHVAQLNVIQRDAINSYGALFDAAGADGIPSRFGLGSKELYFVRNQQDLDLYKTNIDAVKNVYGTLIDEIGWRLSLLQSDFTKAIKTPEAASAYKARLYQEVSAKGTALVLVDGKVANISIDDLLRKSLDMVTPQIINGEAPTQVANIAAAISDESINLSLPLKRRYLTTLEYFRYATEHAKLTGTYEQAVKNAAGNEIVSKFVDEYELVVYPRSYSPYIKPEYQDADILVPKYIAEDGKWAELLSQIDELSMNDAKQIDWLIKAETTKRIRSFISRVGPSGKIASIDGYRNSITKAMSSAIASVKKFGISGDIAIDVQKYIDVNRNLFDWYFNVQYATIAWDKTQWFFTTQNFSKLIEVDAKRYNQILDTYNTIKSVASQPDIDFVSNIGILTDTWYRSMADVIASPKSIEEFSTGTKYLPDEAIEYTSAKNTLSKIDYSSQVNKVEFDDFPAVSFVDTLIDSDCI